MEAVKKQLAQQILDGHNATSWAEWISAKHFPLLLQSILTDACIERGLPTNAGGGQDLRRAGLLLPVDWQPWPIAWLRSRTGLEEKKVTMADLVRAIDANFIGYETLRETFSTRHPSMQ